MASSSSSTSLHGAQKERQSNTLNTNANTKPNSARDRNNALYNLHLDDYTLQPTCSFVTATPQSREMCERTVAEQTTFRNGPRGSFRCMCDCIMMPDYPCCLLLPAGVRSAVYVYMKWATSAWNYYQ